MFQLVNVILALYLVKEFRRVKWNTDLLPLAFEWNFLWKIELEFVQVYYLVVTGEGQIFKLTVV